MNPIYLNWIENKLKIEDPSGNCAEWTSEMQKAFPELIRCAGEVLLANGWVRAHWWLKTEKGIIVDPTASQYNTLYYGFTCIESYYEIPEEKRPIGKCMNCGCDCYENSPSTILCSEKCNIEYHTYIMNSLR